MALPCLVVYISGHGFGHASRSIAVVNTLLAQRPGVRVVVRSSVAPWLFAATADPRVEFETAETDTGVVQFDSLSLDEAATLARARAFMAGTDARAEAEARRLQDLGARLVVFDIPALGPAASSRAGLPSVALGNFTWDWIYAGYDGGADVAAAVGEAYAGTTLALRLPLSGGFATMPAVRDIPFVARHATRSRADLRALIGVGEHERVALSSFGGYGLERLNLQPLTNIRGWKVIVGSTGVPRSVEPPLNDRRTIVERTEGSLVCIDERALYASGFRYEDLVASVDVVVTKPGYGIVSECLANDTALVYTDRGRFAEYEVMVREMPAFLKCAYIGHGELLAGRWGPALDAAFSRPVPPERPPTDGAGVAAAEILHLFDGDRS